MLTFYHREAARSRAGWRPAFLDSASKLKLCRPEQEDVIMDTTFPPTAVIRIAHGNFDPARLPEVERMAEETASYLIPAIQKLPGLIRYFAILSPTGQYLHVSIWETDRHAQQMASLKEMIVDARQAAEAVGVQFIPLVNYSISWTI
jgi:hypothetical protein